MAQKMVSLKMTPKEAKTDMGIGNPPSGKMDLPKYPYDTKVRLGTETLAKLGISPADFKVGEVMEITARVEVAETSMSERQSGERNSLELQITDIALDAGKIKKAKAADKHLNAIGEGASEADEE